jgi:hypothetical protein
MNRAAVLYFLAMIGRIFALRGVPVTNKGCFVYPAIVP